MNVRNQRGQDRVIVTRDTSQTLRKRELCCLRRSVFRQTRKSCVIGRSDGLVELANAHSGHDVCEQLAFADEEVGLVDGGCGFNGLQGFGCVEFAFLSDDVQVDASCECDDSRWALVRVKCVGTALEWVRPVCDGTAGEQEAGQDGRDKCAAHDVLFERTID